MKNGLTLAQTVVQKTEFKALKEGFMVWRLNSGVAAKQYENQERVTILMRALKRAKQSTLEHYKLVCYHRWKRMCLREGHGHRETFQASLSDLVADGSQFDSCVESDEFLSQVVCQKAC